MDKRGEILIENIIFIILNLIFLSILILFLFKQGSGAIVLEQSYAKQIALLIDACPEPNPAVEINLYMKKAKKLAEKNGIDFGDVVQINDNLVLVQLSEKGGYSYSFFNDVKVNPYTDGENYVFSIVKNDE